MSRHFVSLGTISLGTIAAMTAAVLSVAAPAGAQTPATPCGTPPEGYNVIVTDARFITGTSQPDFICAGDSNNIIRAKGQDDIIFARGGNDVIWAGYGNDTIWAGDGNDVIRAGGGKDAVAAGAGQDSVFGGAGADRIRGEAGNDTITGGDGHDSIDGGDGADKLVGNRGIDRIVGGLGDDVGQGGAGTDTILGGGGDDILNGGDHDDIIGGGNGNDRLLGGNGNDVLTGGNGNDALIGGGNPDTLRGSGGNDLLDGGNGLNTTIGGLGTDQCKNADTPQTTCEFVDGIDQSAPPARIWLLVPSAESPGALVGGTSWTPNSEIDITILNAAGAPIAAPEVVVSDATGYWELIISRESLRNGSILAGDSAAGREKILTPVLTRFEWRAAAENLIIAGPAGESMEAQIFAPGNDDDLIFVEQMTFDERGISSANFSEVPEIGLFQLRRSDDDGDVELHSNVATVPAATPVIVATPTVDVAILQVPDEDVAGIFIEPEQPVDAQ